ncbi:MAG TPA: alternate F1F0 ATPase, F1 subunit alpha [Candidatus Ozemobacteraceae bacterium]|nr:alternate F1F0 ATPase, F1 subunit alpha [Candidatus Ozemobacteraceae bacterium]
MKKTPPERDRFAGRPGHLAQEAARTLEEALQSTSDHLGIREVARSPGPPEGLRPILARAVQAYGKALQAAPPDLAIRETGFLERISTGVAIVRGLPDVRLDELVRFGNGCIGAAVHLDTDHVGCILFGRGDGLSAGTPVQRLGRVMDVPVGESLLGRIIDPLGHPLDGAGPLGRHERLPVERPAPAITDREPVTVPLQTGIKVIDALIPIGRGQRQLILGDRQTGKSSIALAAMVNQRDTGVISVYCAIGQRGASVAKVIGELRASGALPRCVVVVAEPAEGPGLEYLAPYAATSIAEWFMERGRDVLVVYDDLGSHARAWRELSLLMRRPPGREAFPGDVFYIHSRLLERSTHLNRERGGGSLTALPIVETEAQNISAYIPTNLISITDGQLYLSPTLFQKGILPAIDIGRSVSRVGGKAQLPAYHAAAAEVKLRFSQFEELETFARFGTRLDEPTRRVIEHGRRIRACLKQGPLELCEVTGQILLLLALTRGLLEAVPPERMVEAQRVISDAAQRLPPELRGRLTGRTPFSGDDETTLLALLREALTAAGDTP